MSTKRRPRYIEAGRYPYHFACTKILPHSTRNKDKGPRWYREATHGCWCSAWQQQADGTFLQWRDGKWQQPIKGAIKSKPEPQLFD
jgi:hypothetical protein